MSARGMTGMSYARTRQIILIAGLVVLIIVAGVMYVRRVDPIEVGATLLFIPIFIGFIFKGMKGGLIGAAIAILAYAALRYPAIQLVGTGRFTSLILSRSLAYLAFGVIGGLASQQLEASLTKLDLFDQIDDDTGLFNARFFVDNTGLEMGRSERYRTLFSVTIVDVPGTAFEAMNKRVRERAVRELGEILKSSVRTVDRAVHVKDGNMHRFAAILPETARDGATVFVTRLVAKMQQLLEEQGAGAAAPQVQYDVSVYPGDDADLQALRERFAAIDALEHPETAPVPPAR